MTRAELFLKHAQNVSALQQAILIDVGRMEGLAPEDEMAVRKAIEVLAEGEKRLMAHRRVITAKIGQTSHGTPG